MQQRKSLMLYIMNAKLPTVKAHGYQIVKMCEEFGKAGVDLELWVPRRRNSIMQSVFDYYSVERAFHIRYFWCIDLFQYFPSSVAYWIQLITFYAAIKFALLFHRRCIIYTRDYWPLFFRMLGFTVVCEVHRLPERLRWFFFRLYRWFAARIITVTSSMRDVLLAYGILSDCVLVSPDGVDLAIFDIQITKEIAREKFQLPHNGKFLLYSGSLQTMLMEKGLNIIFEALRILPLDVRLLIVGGEVDDIAPYASRVRTLGIGDRVMFISRVSRVTLALYQKAADVLVMPFPFTTHYAYYMSPLKMFEYMASERPIVVTDLPSVRSVLDDTSAVLVPPNDASALAQGITHLLEDAVFAERIAQAAYRQVQQYSWDKRAKNIMEFINT